LVLNIGSGNSVQIDGVINFDLMIYEKADIFSDILHLPFKENIVDALISLALQEYVQELALVLKEVHRFEARWEVVFFNSLYAVIPCVSA
jgi:hypothetical protein